MTERTPANKGKRLPPEPLSNDEVKALIAGCSKRAPTGIRNQALIGMLYRAGLRLDEALSLKPRDLNRAIGEIRVRHGKGDKSRVVGMGQTAWALLERWLDKRASLGINGRRTVFCTLQGRTMKAAYVRSLLPRLARKAEIEKRVHAHGLRHTCAYELASEGVPVHEIQLMLGHSQLATTARYISHLNPRQVVERMASRDWNL